jgi:hypothetical protein
MWSYKCSDEHYWSSDHLEEDGDCVPLDEHFGSTTKTSVVSDLLNYRTSGKGSVIYLSCTQSEFGRQDKKETCPTYGVDDARFDMCYANMEREKSVPYLCHALSHGKVVCSFTKKNNKGCRLIIKTTHIDDMYIVSVSAETAIYNADDYGSCDCRRRCTCWVNYIPETSVLVDTVILEITSTESHAKEFYTTFTSLDYDLVVQIVKSDNIVSEINNVGLCFQC